MSKWQPIETAPANISVLVYIPNAEHYGEGIYRAILVDSRPAQREAYWTTTALHCGRDPGTQLPTHWRPLPNPPENTTQITIWGNHMRESRTVDALIVGPLAVHRELVGDSWVVTHVATGWAVTSFMVTKQRAKHIAEALQGFDWDFTDPKDPKVKAMASAVADTIKSVAKVQE